MDNFIGILLYVTGYTYDYKENVNDKPLSIRSSSNNTYITREVSQEASSIWSQVLGFLYNALIVCIMSWRTVYTLYMSIDKRDILPFGRSVFQILFVWQYILGIIYFRQQHFYRNISTKSDMLKLLKYSAPFTILISALLAILYTIFLVKNINIHGYTDLYDKTNTIGHVFLCILLFVDTFYSHLTFSINTCIFVVNMIFHKKKVSEYARSLSNDYIKTTQDETVKVTTIAIGYSLMKDSFDETVDALGWFFASLNFAGFISIYFYIEAIKNDKIAYNEITDLILFGLVEIVYIIAIQAVNASIEKISDAVSSTSMVAMYFTDEKDDNHTLNMISQSHKNHVVAGKTTNDSIVMSNNTGENTGENTRGEAGENMDGDVQNEEFNFDNYKKNQNNNNDILSEKEDVYITDPYLSSSMRNVVTNVNGTQNMMSWMALRSITCERWKTFRFFGVELTDNTLISKLLGAFVALGIGSSIGSSIGWW